MIVILAVITMNAVLGTVQTVKASASLDSLKQMSAPTAKVLRDGQIVQIPGREVVPGECGHIGGGRFRLCRRTPVGVCQSEMRGECSHRRKPAGGKGYGAAQRRNGLRRPKEHGVLRQLCHLWAGPLSGDGHRHGHGNGQDRPASEKHGGAENAAAGQSGPVRQKAVDHHSGDLRSAVWRQRAVAARKRDERLPLRRALWQWRPSPKPSAPS